MIHKLQRKSSLDATPFRKAFSRFYYYPRKELLAADDQLLIDDNEGHVEKMRQRGGHAVLVPALANGVDGYQDHWRRLLHKSRLGLMSARSNNI